MTRRKLLLTGAGFTANFGAPLASQMWNWLYGHAALRNQEQLRDKMRSDQDYERIYFEVMNGEYADGQKQAMAEAMIGAYRDMDRILCDCERDRIVNATALDQFVESFAGQRRNRGYYFTLNQDIYLERWYINGERPLLPGLPPHRVWRDAMNRTVPLTDADSVIVPGEDEVRQAREALGQHDRFVYLKLHGSANWTKQGGHAQMVIGAQKEEAIRGEPLLSWYMDLFRQALHEPNRLLLVIGYGFGDAHINSIIGSAIREAGLRFVVVSPEPADKLIWKLKWALPDHSEVLAEGLTSHIPYTVREIFPAGLNTNLRDVTSAGWKLLRRDFYDEPE